jgi:hypothetical protein
MRFDRIMDIGGWSLIGCYDGDRKLTIDSVAFARNVPNLRWEVNLALCQRWIFKHTGSASRAWEETRRLFPEHADLIDEMVLDLAKRAILHV